MADDAEDFVAMLQEYSDNFDRICQQMRNDESEVIGPLQFLGEDVVSRMLDELARTANYCRYQAIKILILQGQLEQKLPSMGFPEGKADLQIGWPSKPPETKWAEGPEF